MHLVLFLATLFASTAFAGSEVEDLILAGRFADAAPIAEKQAEAAPNDLRSQVQYIDVMAALGLASAVEPIYIRQSEAAPTDADAQFLRGRAATSLERAEAAYRKALTLNSGHARAHAGIGTIRRVQGDLESAETSFRSALAVDDSLGEAWGGLGSVLILRGKKDAALEVGRRAMAKAPSHVESYLAVASLDPSSAGDVLGKAATIAPRDPRVHSALARHHLTLGDAESAMAAAHNALTVDPLGAEARRWALYASAMSSGTLDASGFEQADRARMQGSVDLWAPLLASYPNCALLWVERSATHASLGQVYSAKKDVQHALELDADNVEAHAALGLLLLNDDPVAARPHLQKAADGRPIDASLQVATAMAEAQSGDMAGARRRLKSTVDTHPYDIRALLTYGQVLSAEDPQATYALMADAVQRMPDTRVVLALIGAAKDAGRLPDAAKRLEELAASTGNPAFTEAASVVRGAKP